MRICKSMSILRQTEFKIISSHCSHSKRPDEIVVCVGEEVEHPNSRWKGYVRKGPTALVGPAVKEQVVTRRSCVQYNS